RHIPRAQKQLVVIMKANGSPREQIAEATGFHIRTVDRILSTWRATGKVARVPLQLGRPRILTSLDVLFLEGLVERTPDIYLFELQNALAEATGLDVDKNTIRDALFRRGYTRKVVRISIYLNAIVFRPL
ncbi:Homeodomain-like protein, partial [Mycena capillaripes]